MSSQFNFEAIGFVESCYKDKFGTPRQPGLAPHSKACLKINSQWQPEQSLQGLAQFSHLWVLFVFHQNTNQRFHAKVHPPRLNGESIGVFATRSPHRPNPIGLSLVKVEKVEKDCVYISGIDLVEGTPVLDIKPYLSGVESKTEAQEGWVEEAKSAQHQILWTEEQLQSVGNWAKSINQPDLKALIDETLALDPRPLLYRGYEGQESPYREVHAVRLFDGDIHFRFIDSNSIELVKILRL